MRIDFTILNRMTEGMDIPSKRREDIGWMRRNLGIRNGGHPRFHDAMVEVNRLWKSMVLGKEVGICTVKGGE